MKKNIALVILLFLYIPSFALHIAGGELFYRYVGPGTAANSDRYSITLRLFRECNPVTPPGQSAAPMPSEVEIGVFSNSGTSGTLYKDIIVQRSEKDVVSLQAPLTCIVNPPSICYEIGYFNFTMDLPKSADGYTVAYQTCCRSFIILNVQFFNIPGQPTSGEGATYACVIPGTNILGNNETNSSAVFDVKDTVLVCQQKKIRLDFSATDPDSENPAYGDSLSYSFCDAYNRGVATSSGNVLPSAPPYQSVSYAGGYAGEFPMGTDVAIDPKTGIITGTIGAAGGYVVNVCVAEWRHGKVIGVHRKDFLLRVTSCDFAAADLDPVYLNCDSLSFNFQNNSTSSAIKSYFWDFGDKNNSADTSLNPTPNYTYPDTGAYTIKLIVNKGQQCSDSATALVETYPGFAANFGVQGSCLQTPYQFIDSTVSRYGTVNSWLWAFGDGSTTSDTADPLHSYTSSGIKNVSLTAGDTKGCKKTVVKPVEIRDRPLINLPFRDTLVCNSDTLQLSASTTVQGTYTWTPDVNIINANTAQPMVFPTDTAKYIVSFNDGKGCFNSDSVTVNVVDSAFVYLGNDTTICLGDTVQLAPSTNALYFSWSPAAALSNSSAESPYTAPVTSTNYVVVAKISKHCIASDDIVINEIPYPQANAGPDVSVCYGKTVQLSASIRGSSFAWTPSNSLYKANTLAPYAGPQTTTTYLLTVYDTLNKPNCPKPALSYVTVKVIPPVQAYAGHDTSIVVGQPLQLNATGGSSYTWQPVTGLDNPDIANPISLPPAGITSITYTVKVADSNNCAAYANVTVNIYQTQPEIFVPTAFSPNGDGHNDILRPIVAGLKEFDYFKIYNRWGNLVFSSSNSSDGWDGTYGGAKQQSGTYVFVARGIDYMGHQVSRKGTVVLIR
ncbi:MAG TPA: PKD domain-containing protein [Chitinophagaceae bacterium]|nr:PKD domain-containing protein [Chitinophagaceae bacterium]